LSSSSPASPLRPRLVAAALLVLLGSGRVAAQPASAAVQAQPVPEAPPPPDAPPPPPPPEPAPSAVVDPARVDDIDQRSRILERKLELLEEGAATRKTTDVLVTANDRGFNAKSADGAFSFRLRGLLQADGREFVKDDVLALRSTFLLRKVRPIFEATLFNLVDLRIMPDFGGGTTVLQDAYADVRLTSWLAVRGGKWKAPLALERHQSDAAVVFPERGLPTFLSSNREVGFGLTGAVLGGAVQYDVGVFNGGLDNGTEDLDTNQAKDVIGRLFFLPFKGDPYSPLASFGFGIGGSTGKQRGTPAAGTTAAAPQLPAYRTIGQQSFFTYANDVVARGRRSRISPQLYYYVGPVGLLAEYIQTQQTVLKGTESALLKHQSWQVAAFFVLGGKPLFEGTSVTQPFDPARGTLGALELGLRFGQIDIDDAAFAGKTYADPARSATRASSAGAVLNWHWSRNLKWSLSYEHGWFEGGAAGGDRKPENVLFQRIQVAY
jgi:phosphate-selective porin OprO/OprP